MSTADTVRWPGLDLLRSLGALRLMLLGLALATLPLVGGDWDPYGGLWPLLRGGVIPALVPLFFMGLMFDALMARVWLGEAEPAERRRLRRVMWIDMGVAAALAAVWAPFFWAVLNP